MTPDEKRAGEHLKAIRRLLAAGKVLAARSRLTAAVGEGTTAGLWRLQRVLALPTVRRRLPAEPGGAADIEWFRRNAETYRGRWVAVAGGKLVDTDESLAGLRRKLRERPPGPKPLLHRL